MENTGNHKYQDTKHYCSIFIGSNRHTPLNIYNGTPIGRLNRDLRATLPINELHLCTFKTPTKWAVMSERGDADCAFPTERNGVKGNPPEGCPILNLHRCKKSIYINIELYQDF